MEGEQTAVVTVAIAKTALLSQSSSLQLLQIISLLFVVINTCNVLDTQPG